MIQKTNSRDIDWNSLRVPLDAVWVYLIDDEGNKVTLSPGGRTKNDYHRLPSVYDEDGDPFDHFAIEFADGQVVKRPRYNDEELPEWASDE